MKQVNTNSGGLYVNNIGESRPGRFSPPSDTLLQAYGEDRRTPWFFALLSMLTLVLLLSFPNRGLALEYEKTGPYGVVTETVENPMWTSTSGGTPLTVLLPAGAGEPVPVVFFSHGLGATNWSSYRSLLQHIASWGVAVVYSPYPASLSYTSNYPIIWNGFKTAADRYADTFDLSRVGFAGHSWGGGATPYMAVKGKAAGWGSQGMFMFIMAPAPASGVTTADLEGLSGVNLIMQVYENDSICPGSWAESAYDRINSAGKAYYYVYGATHLAPCEPADDLDRLAIWKPLTALMDCTFRLDRPYDGLLYALYGDGVHYETDVEGIQGEFPPEDDDSVHPPADDPVDPPVDDGDGSYASPWDSWKDQWLDRFYRSKDAADDAVDDGSWFDRYRSRW